MLKKAKHDLVYNKCKAAIEETSWITTVVILRTRSTVAIKEDNDIDKILSEVKALATQFASLALKKIAKLFSNCVRPMNLYILRLIKSQDNFYHDQINSNKSILKM